MIYIVMEGRLREGGQVRWAGLDYAEAQRHFNKLCYSAGNNWLGLVEAEGEYASYAQYYYKGDNNG